MKTNKQIIEILINGEPYELAVAPHQTLIEILRDIVGLKGTKEGCGTGECGSCTVLMDGEPVLSCLLPAIECQGRDITTIEGVGGADTVTPVQEAFLEKGAVQCGFCIPGMVLATTSLLNRDPNPTETQIKKALEGHLCRCTGYNKILEAVELAVEKMSSPG